MVEGDDGPGTDRVAIVTGGSEALGREIVLALAARGYAVVVAYAGDQAAADRTVDEVLGAGGEALAVRADVTDEVDVERLFVETAEAFGGVDIVVHADARGTDAVNRRAAPDLRAGGSVVDVTADATRADPAVAQAVAQAVASLLDTREPTRDLPGREPGATARPFGGTEPREVNVSGTDVSEGASTDRPGPGPVDLRLEVVVLGVSDVDRAKQFYEALGFRLDADFTAGDLRVVQLTPPGSPCSIIFGTNLTSAAPGSADSLMLVVKDIDEARAYLVARGAEVSEVFHDAGGVFHHAGTAARVPGPDPEGRSYSSFASFSDPDGNGWVLQEITTRLPGR